MYSGSSFFKGVGRKLSGLSNLLMLFIVFTYPINQLPSVRIWQAIGAASFFRNF